MFGFFLELVFRSIKLDKKLYKEVKTFSEVSIYFAAIIMILDGVAGAIATNNFYPRKFSNNNINNRFMRWRNIIISSICGTSVVSFITRAGKYK